MCLMSGTLACRVRPTNLGQLRTIGGEQLRVQVANPGPTRVTIVFVNGMGVFAGLLGSSRRATARIHLHQIRSTGKVDRQTSGWDSPQTSAPRSTDLSVSPMTRSDRVAHSCLLVIRTGGIIAETAARLELQRTMGLVLVDGTDPLQHANDDTRLEAVLAPALAPASSIPGFASTVGGAVERSRHLQQTVNPDGPRLTPEQRIASEVAHTFATSCGRIYDPHHCRQALEIARSAPLPPIPVTLLVSSEERTLMGTRRASD